MRPQFLHRSLGLLQRTPNRSFVPTGLLRKTLSSSPRVPDFAFAFEYAIFLLLVLKILITTV